MRGPSMKNFLALAVAATWVISACSPCPPTNSACNQALGGGGGFGGGGTGGGGGGLLSNYTVTTLDPTLSDDTYLDAIFDPANNRVGVAYFSGMDTLDGGTMAAQFDVRY